MASFEHILVATDFGEPSARALDLALHLATESGAELTLLHTFEIPQYAYTETTYLNADWITPLQRAAHERLDRLLEETRKTLPRARALLRTGSPWREVLAAAEEEGADLVVIGTHGRRGLRHALLGSVAEKIVRMASVPVLTVRAPKAD